MGQLKITDTQYFMMNNDHSSPYNLFIYKITFGSTSVNWAKTMICPSGSWTAGFWESILSSDSTKIYSLFTYGSSNYFYFTTFANSDGSILSSRYKSSIAWGAVYSATLNGDYIIAPTSCSSYTLVVLNLSTFVFKYYVLSSNYLLASWYDTASGR